LFHAGAGQHDLTGTNSTFSQILVEDAGAVKRVPPLNLVTLTRMFHSEVGGFCQIAG
jgi:hypothetical protein